MPRSKRRKRPTPPPATGPSPCPLSHVVTGSFDTIATITPLERALLHEVARSLSGVLQHADTPASEDGAYFKAHPEESWYIRPYRPGEFGPFSDAEIAGVLDAEITHVLVEQLAPGIRVRKALYSLDMSPRGGREEGGAA